MRVTWRTRWTPELSRAQQVLARATACRGSCSPRIGTARNEQRVVTARAPFTLNQRLADGSCSRPGAAELRTRHNRCEPAAGRHHRALFHPAVVLARYPCALVAVRCWSRSQRAQILPLRRPGRFVGRKRPAAAASRNPAGYVMAAPVDSAHACCAVRPRSSVVSACVAFPADALRLRPKHCCWQAHSLSHVAGTPWGYTPRPSCTSTGTRNVR